MGRHLDKVIWGALGFSVLQLLAAPLALSAGTASLAYVAFVSTMAVAGLVGGIAGRARRPWGLSALRFYGVLWLAVPVVGAPLLWFLFQDDVAEQFIPATAV